MGIAAVARTAWCESGYINPRAKVPTPKGEVVRLFDERLGQSGVECFQDWSTLIPCAKDRVEGEIKGLPGMSSGVLLRYFEMLVGDDSQVKPDRMILGFIHDETGVLARPDDAVDIVRDACSLLKVAYPAMTPRLLDHTIWEYQRKKK